jgi:hypothetical protein
MLKIILPAAVAVLAALLTPSKVDAWGAAHVGYTHVGPRGVSHAGRTAVAGPRGAAVGGRAGAVGAGGAYGARYGGAARRGGGAAVGGARYGYIR